MGKRQDFIDFGLSILIVVVLIVLSRFVILKFDLTEEKRHTLTYATKTLLGRVDDNIFVRCYLTGQLPAHFKRLERSIQERLDEFRDYSGRRLDYEFVDPYESGDKKTNSEVEKRLWEEGLRFSQVAYEEGGVKKFSLVWPAAVVSYKGRDLPVQFLKSETPHSPAEMVNASINNIEYELAQAIARLMRTRPAKVGLLEGQGQLSDAEIADFANALQEQYNVEWVKIDGKVNALTENLEGVKERVLKFDALIVAKPRQPFERKDQILLDHYIMHGGRVLWLIDPILTDLDSLSRFQQTVGITNELGIYDMLYDYGVRLNRNIVIDRSCAPIAFDAGPVGNQRNIQLFPWYFSPILIPSDTAHPMVTNLDPILVEFASSMDTVGENPDIRKTVLLTTSPYSREFRAPVRINSGIVNIDPNFKEHNKPFQIVSVLLEGDFRSSFADRLADTLKRSADFNFKEFSGPNKMIVVSDGDIARNQVVVQGGQEMIRPLGYDRYAGAVVYDNKEFLLNAVNYLLGDSELISVRSRTIQLRKLNEELIIGNRFQWQVINVALPMLLVVLIGLVLFLARRRAWR
jgi:ABC-2 type transport system permease protein